MLPDAVMQQLGWAQPPPLVPPFDPSLAGAPGPDQFAPTIPPPMPQLPPPQPQQATAPEPSLALPSMAQPQGSAPEPPAPSKDYPVPQSAFGGGQPQVKPGTPRPQSVKPKSPEQMLAEAQGKQQQADQTAEAAISAQAQADFEKNHDLLAAQEQHNTRAAEIEKQRKAEADEFAKTHAQKQAYVDATLKEADNYKIDQNKYMHDLGLGSKIGLYIAMAMSGLGEAMQGRGGQNPVVQMIQQKMHQSVEMQMDERDQLKQKNARAEHALDKYDAFAKDRAAQTNLLDARNDYALANMIATAAAKNADPQDQARAMKSVADLRESGAQKAEQAAMNAATVQHQKQMAGIAGGQLAETTRHNKVEEGWQQDKLNTEAALKMAALDAKAKGKLNDEESKRAIFVPAPDGSRVALRNRNGDVVLAGDPAIAQKQRDMVAAAEAYNRLVGRMSRAIEDHGGESTWIKGTEWQKMESDLQSATAELHDAYGITAFREPTVKFFEKMASAGVDPTSFVRDARGALQESNLNLQAKLNEKLGALGYDGAAIKFADTSSPPKPLETPEDKALTVAMGSRSDDPGAVYDPEAGRYQPRIPGAYRIDIDKSSVPAPSPRDLEVQAKYPKMGAAQRSLVETWGAALKSPDPNVSGRAAEILGKLANDADEQGVRDYAQQMLSNNTPTPQFTESTTMATGRTSGGRSEAPPNIQAPPEWILPRR